MNYFKGTLVYILILFPTIAKSGNLSTGNNENKVNKTDVSGTIQLLKNAAEQNEFLFGHQDFPFYGVHWLGDPGRSDVKDVCKDYPAVLGVDLGGIESGGDKNLDGVPFNKMREEIISQYKRGGLITVSWHSRNPLTGGDAWDVSNKTVVRSILPQGTNHAKFTGWLDRVAVFLNSLKTDNGQKIPVIFRPWHEHMGSWFWWGQELCTPEEYKKLWKMTVSYLRKKKVDHLVLAYSPNLVVDQKDYMQRYPGDKWVDIFGVDSYHTGGTKDAIAFISNLKKGLEMMTYIAKEHNKIIAITETGSEGLPMPKWWTQVLYPSISSYPVSYVLVWRNANEKLKKNHFYAPYLGQLSADDFVEFYSFRATVFAKDMQLLLPSNRQNQAIK